MGCAQSSAGDEARIVQGSAGPSGTGGSSVVAADAAGARTDTAGAAAVGQPADAEQANAREIERKVSLIRDAVGSLPGIDVEMIKACLHEQQDDVERAVNVLLDGSFAASLAAHPAAQGGNSGSSRAGWRWRGSSAKHSEHAVAAASDTGVWTTHLHIQTGRRYYHNHAAPGSESVWHLPVGAVADVVDEEEIIELADYIDELKRELRARGQPAAGQPSEDGAGGEGDQGRGGSGGGGGGSGGGRGGGGPQSETPEPVAAILANLDYSTSIRLAMHQSRRHAAALAKLAPGAADPSTPRARDAVHRSAAESTGEVRFLRPAERFPRLRVEQLAVDGQHAAVFRSAEATAAGAGAGAGACTDVCVNMAISLLTFFQTNGADALRRLLRGEAARGGGGGGGLVSGHLTPHDSPPHAIAGGALGAGMGGAGRASRRLQSQSQSPAPSPMQPPHSPPTGADAPAFLELRRLVSAAIRTGTHIYDAQGDQAQMHYVEEALRLAELHGVQGAAAVHKQRADVLFNLPVTCDDAQPLSIDAFCATLQEAAKSAGALNAPVCAIVVAERTAWTVMLLLFADCALCIDPHGSEGQAAVVALRGPTDDLVRMSAEALQLVSMRPLYPTFESPAQPRVWLDPMAGQTEVTLLALRPTAKGLLR